MQADLLLRIASVTEAPVPAEIIFGLPRMQVVYDDSPVSGSAHWDGRDWIVVVNQRQREPRRRVTLMHELKHIIDHTTRAFLYTGMARLSPIEQAEQAAEFFAGCLLMPSSQIRKAAAGDCRTAQDFARRFIVPVGFAARRLHQLGLAPDQSRQMLLLTEETWPSTQLDVDAALGAEA